MRVAAEVLTGAGMQFITANSPPPSNAITNATTSSSSSPGHAAAIAVPVVVGFVIIGEEDPPPYACVTSAQLLCAHLQSSCARTMDAGRPVLSSSMLLNASFSRKFRSKTHCCIALRCRYRITNCMTQAEAGQAQCSDSDMLNADKSGMCLCSTGNYLLDLLYAPLPPAKGSIRGTVCSLNHGLL